MSRLVAAFIVGEQNVTRITTAGPLNDATLDRLARYVATGKPWRTYYVMLVEDRLWKKRRGHDPLYVWHVGEGFEHADGWWVGYE